MTLISFLKLAEIQTKVASMIPFLLGTVYTLYRFRTFNGMNFLLMLVSLLAFDMVTTVINNYIDYKKAHKKHGFNYESHNAIVHYNLRESAVITAISILLAIAAAFGFMLYLKTDGVVLLIGAVSFMVGVLYSFGPLPISRMPLGEVFSGFFMGFVIVFLSAYIHIHHEEILQLALSEGLLMLRADMWGILLLFLVSLPAVVGIANIMLANNICDIDDDLENKRYTLPIYIGRERALLLFSVLYHAVYFNIILLLILGWLPWITVFVLLTLVPVRRNIDAFYQKQSKAETFVLAVKNFVLMNGSLIVLLGIGALVFR